ncbi:MAG TPA: hypothetical protein VGD94_12330 [Vicinamibacterales bacterium]
MELLDGVCGDVDDQPVAEWATAAVRSLEARPQDGLDLILQAPRAQRPPHVEVAPAVGLHQLLERERLAARPGGPALEERAVADPDAQPLRLVLRFRLAGNRTPERGTIAAPLGLRAAVWHGARDADDLADSLLEGEAEMFAVPLEVEMPGMRALRPGAAGAVAEFSDPVVSMSLLQGEASRWKAGEPAAIIRGRRVGR